MAILVLSLGFFATPGLAENLQVNANQLAKQFGSELLIYEIVADKLVGTKTIDDNIVRSPDHLSCIRTQINELNQVAEMSGGFEHLKQEMKKNDLQFRIFSPDERQAASPLHPKEDIDVFATAPGLVTFGVFSKLYVDKKTGLIKCDVVKAAEIYKRLSDPHGLDLKLNSPTNPNQPHHSKTTS